MLLLVLASAVLDTAQAPLTPQPGTQTPAVTFRSEVNFVEVPAIVTDESGAFVRGLTVDDFEIYEDGRLQKPVTFALTSILRPCFSSRRENRRTMSSS